MQKTKKISFINQSYVNQCQKLNLPEKTGKNGLLWMLRSSCIKLISFLIFCCFLIISFTFLKFNYFFTFTFTSTIFLIFKEKKYSRLLIVTNWIIEINYYSNCNKDHLKSTTTKNEILFIKKKCAKKDEAFSIPLIIVELNN